MVVRYDRVNTRHQHRTSRTPDVERCTFTFGFEGVMSAVAAAIQSHWADTRRSVGFRTRDQFVSIGLALHDANASGQDVFDVSTRDWDRWWMVALPLESERRFTSVRCELCDKDFAPAAITVEQWAVENVGGRMYRCAEGHILYCLGEWIS